MTEDIMGIFRDYIGTALITETVLAGIYALFAILMIAGVKSRVRGLMVPYLVYQERNSMRLMSIARSKVYRLDKVLECGTGGSWLEVTFLSYLKGPSRFV